MQVKVPIEVKIDMDEIIDRLKEDDFVQVVRCKNCKHYMNVDENYPDEYGNCPTVCMYMPDDAEENGYCHRAEREEE